MKRIYAPGSIYDHFADALCDRLANTAVGHGPGPQSGYGPLNNKKQYDAVNDMNERTRSSSVSLVNLGAHWIPRGGPMGINFSPRRPGHGARCAVARCRQVGPMVPIIAYGDEYQVSMKELELDEIHNDDVRVKMAATGICQTDAIIRDGVYPTPLPAVLGHEGNGSTALSSAHGTPIFSQFFGRGGGVSDHHLPLFGAVRADPWWPCIRLI